MSTLLLVAVVIGVAVVAVLIIGLIAWGFERDLSGDGPRPTSGPSAGMFGGVAEIFDPAAHRAQLEREQQRHAATVATTPSGDDTDRSRMETDARGNPTRLVVRRPR